MVGIQSKLRSKLYIHCAYNVIMETDAVTITIIGMYKAETSLIKRSLLMIMGICVYVYGEI